jgi:hypothetical protein
VDQAEYVRYLKRLVDLVYLELLVKVATLDYFSQIRATQRLRLRIGRCWWAGRDRAGLVQRQALKEPPLARRGTRWALNSTIRERQINPFEIVSSPGGCASDMFTSLQSA